MNPSRHTTVAQHYAEAVVAGSIPSCRWVQLACQRQLNDLARFNQFSGWYFFACRRVSTGVGVLCHRHDICFNLLRYPLFISFDGYQAIA